MSGVVVITGAAGGLGRGLALAAARRRLPVLLLGLESTGLAAAAESVAAAGGEAATLVADVTDPEGMRAAADLAFSRWEGVRLLVNNAGIETVAPLWEQAQRTRRTVAIATVGVLNIASVGAFTAGAGQGAYQIGKRAMLAASESLAADLAAAGSAITVTTAFPGPVKTGIFASAATAQADPASERMRAALDRMLLEHGMSAEDAGETILAAALAGAAWVTTDAVMAAALAQDLAERTSRLVEALAHT